jgi:hypothetical protein
MWYLYQFIIHLLSPCGARECCKTHDLLYLSLLGRFHPLCPHLPFLHAPFTPAARAIPFLYQVRLIVAAAGMGAFTLTHKACFKS